MSPLFVVRLNVLFSFATKNLIKKPFLVVSGHIPVFLGRGGLILSYFRERGLCGLCGPSFKYILILILVKAIYKIELVYVRNKTMTI